MIDFNDKRQVAKAIQYTNVNPNLTREGMLKHLYMSKNVGVAGLR